MAADPRRSKQGAAPSGSLPAWLAWAPRVVTDRRWAGPLGACALGLGLFIGVAIGPGASGGLASGAGQIIRLPASLFGSDSSGSEPGGGGGGSESGAPLAALGAPVGNAAIPAGPAKPPVAPPAALPFAPTTSPVLPSPAPAAPERPEPPARPGNRPRPSSPGHKPPPQKQTLSGVVVHVNPAAHSYTVAAAGSGAMSAVHASQLPEPGSVLKTQVRALFNGTYAEQDRSRSRKASSAKITGIVTAHDVQTGSYTVSKRGISLLVGVHPDPESAEPPEPPALGSYVEVAVKIDKIDAQRKSRRQRSSDDSQSCTPDAEPVPPPEIEPAAHLWQSSLEVTDHFDYSDFEGIVTACPGTGRLVLSADDIREAGSDLTFSVARGIDLSRLTIGESVDAAASIGEDGSLELSGVVSDEGTAGADDASTGQGDLAG
jgi:hypothetical protein